MIEQILCKKGAEKPQINPEKQEIVELEDRDFMLILTLQELNERLRNLAR